MHRSCADQPTPTLKYHPPHRPAPPPPHLCRACQSAGPPTRRTQTWLAATCRTRRTAGVWCMAEGGAEVGSLESGRAAGVWMPATGQEAGLIHPPPHTQQPPWRTLTCGCGVKSRSNSSRMGSPSTPSNGCRRLGEERRASGDGWQGRISRCRGRRHQGRLVRCSPPARQSTRCQAGCR